MFRLAASLIFVATAAFADGFPAHFNVTGVAQDDRLNIRAEPDAQSDVIGDYGPYQLNIEVLRLSEDGRWAFVGAGEQNGWVAARYLERQNHLPAGAFPRPLTCFGTEPFWTLTAGVRGDEFNALDGGRYDLESTEEAVSQRGQTILGGQAVFEGGATVRHTITFKRGLCGDGMSDREFGWQALLFTQSPEGNDVASGCCTMDFTN